MRFVSQWRQSATKSEQALTRDELLQKITEAERLASPPDLWILATTKSIDASTRDALHEHAASLGMGVVVLDSSASVDGLSELCGFCALGANRLTPLLGEDEKTEAALNYISAHPSFEVLAGQIVHRLTRADVGYDAAKRKSRYWLREAQQSIANAQSRLGGRVNPGADNSLVKRTDITAAINDWYASGRGSAVLLGDEGVGKSLGSDGLGQ